MAELTLGKPTHLTISRPEQAPTVNKIISRSLPAFIVLCIYILSNAYLVPVMQLGPSWAVWPAISDFVIVFMALVVFVPLHPRSENSRNFLIVLMFVSLFLIMSFLIQTVWFPMAGIRSQTDSRGITFGIFQVFRIVQMGIVCYAVSATPMTETRLAILRWVVLVTLVVVCAGIIATYFHLVTYKQLAGHITDNPFVGGPWSASYKNYTGKDGLGTIGYNHSYPSTQVVLLVAFYVFLVKNKGSWSLALIVGLSFFAVFLTGSRSGLAAMLIWVGGFFLHRPHYILAGIVTTILALILIATNVVSTSGIGGQAVERQSALTGSLDSEALSGRPALWKDHLGYLERNPFRVLVGYGFGSAMETGHYSHQNYLEIVMETGLLGLFIGGAFAVNLLTRLWEVEPGSRSIFWMTVGLMVGATNVEMLYPVAHRGHFLNLFVLVVVIVFATVWKNSNKLVTEVQTTIDTTSTLTAL